MSSYPGLLGIRSDVPGVLWPPIVETDSAMFGAFMQTLDRTQWLSADEVASGQGRQLKALAKHLAKKSPLFANRLKRAGLKADDLDSAAALRQLPLTTRRDVQDAAAGFVCSEVPESHQPTGSTQTSGSTGEPVVVTRTALNHLFWLAGTLRDHLWHERDFTGRMVAIRANIDVRATNESWGSPVSILFNSGPSLALPITTDVAELFRELAQFRPSNVIIYPNTLAAIATFAAETGRGLPSVRQFRCVGETVDDALRVRVKETLGASIAANYSSQECGAMAIECPQSGLYHVMAENHLVEVLDETGRQCAVGEVGRIAVTDLHNFATPLVRYDIGDYAEVGPPCPCGRGLPTLSRILGRERNLIVMPDGSRFWPRVGFARFREVAPVRRYQLIQTAVDEIVVRLVVSRPMTGQEKADLSSVILSALGASFRLVFEEQTDDFEKVRGGKFEEFVCRVPTPPRA